MSEIKNEAKIRYENRIRQEYIESIQEVMDGKQGKGIFRVPIGLAVEQGITGNMPQFLRVKNFADKNSISHAEAHKQITQNSLNPKSNTTAINLIGGNGIGKTEMTMEILSRSVREKGLIPVIYDPTKGDASGVMRPTGANKENQCLFVYMSCVGLEAFEVKGMPIKVDKEREVYGEDFEVLMEKHRVIDEETGKSVEIIREVHETVPTLTYSEVARIASLGNFNYAVLILDEKNRSPELNMFNALQTGEPIDGIKTPRYGMFVVSMENSSEDGLNNANRVDAAGKTKTDTYIVYQTATAWARYAQQKGLHPAVISFVLRYPHVFENQIDNNSELGFPTFRGAERLSTRLYAAEEDARLHGRTISSPEVLILAQAVIGVHGDTTNMSKGNVPAQFVEHYTYSHLAMNKQIEDAVAVTRPHYDIGFLDKEATNRLLKSARASARATTKYYEEKDIVPVTGIEADYIAVMANSGRDYLKNYISKLFLNGEYSAFNFARSLSLQMMFRDWDTGKPDYKKIEAFCKEHDLDELDAKILREVAAADIMKGAKIINESVYLSNYFTKFIEDDLNAFLNRDGSTNLVGIVYDANDPRYCGSEENYMMPQNCLLGFALTSMYQKYTQALIHTFDDASRAYSVAKDMEYEIFVTKHTLGHKLLRKLYLGDENAEDASIIPMVHDSNKEAIMARYGLFSTYKEVGRFCEEYGIKSDFKDLERGAVVDYKDAKHFYEKVLSERGSENLPFELEEYVFTDKNKESRFLTECEYNNLMFLISTYRKSVSQDSLNDFGNKKDLFDINKPKKRGTKP